jgi:hypothetical protein
MKSSLRAHGSREMRARCQAPRSDPDTVIPGWSAGPDLRCAIAHRGISRFRVRCGACHRAALRADPLASPRNDVVWIVVASRLAITSLLFQTHVRDLAAQCARGVDESSAQRGRGECRVPVAPAASRALCIDRTHTSNTSNNEYTGIARHSRTQWFYDLFRALPGDRALLPPSPANMVCLRPVGPTKPPRT